MSRPAQILLGFMLVGGPVPTAFHQLEKRLAAHSGLTPEDVRRVAMCALEELLGLALVEEDGEAAGEGPAFERLSGRA